MTDHTGQCCGIPNNKNDNQLEISLTDNQGNTLVKGTDYELKYDGTRIFQKKEALLR